MGVDGKLEVLNDSVKSLIASLAGLSVPGASAQVAVIRFSGSDAVLHHPLIAADEVEWSPLHVAGRTPLGAALRLARQLVDDRTVVPPRSFRPSLVLVTDGLPTDEWQAGLRELDD